MMLSVPREGDDSTDRMAQALNYCKYLLSGAMSAVVSRSTVAPFERIKMDMLLSKGQGTAFATAVHIVQSEGVLALWKGNILNLMRTAPHKVSTGMLLVAMQRLEKLTLVSPMY